MKIGLRHTVGWDIALKVRSNKLSHKLFIQIALVVAIVYSVSFLINTFFLPKYFLYEKKSALAEIATKMTEIDSADQLINEIEEIENQYRVTIVYTENHSNEDALNWTLREHFSKKGIALSKFWITSENLEKLNEGAIVNKLYNQEKLKSNVLVTFLMKDDTIFAVAESIADSHDTIQIVNQFNTFISIGALFLTIIVAGLFARRMIRPLEQLKDTAEDISKLHFQKVDIKTGDEFQDLAESINRMSDNLEKSQTELETKNNNLRLFIANISHELKTPLALIKAYSMGIKDGLDDGTYLDVIDKQTDQMSYLVNELLKLSRLQTEQYTYTSFDFLQLFKETIEKYELTMQQQHIHITTHIDESIHPIIYADKDKMAMVLNNLFTNSMKYTTNSQIDITISQQVGSIFFSIKNGIENVKEEHLKQLWEPFYVVEQSRNKLLSGTGLGLSIVKTILDKHHFPFGVRKLTQDEIEFYFFIDQND